MCARVGRNASSCNYGWGTFMVIVVLVRKWMEFLNRGIDRFTPKIEAPVDECAVVFVKVGVFDNDCPRANSLFSPVAGQ